MKLLGRFKWSLLIVALASTSNVARSEPFPTLPGPVQPAQVSKSLQQEQRQRTSQPTLSPSVEQPKQEASPLATEAQKIKFVLNGIIIEGNRVYSTDQLKALYADKIHKKITVAELFGIVQGITNYYRNNGYILSRAILPPQHVKNGIVTIRVIEGYIDKVDVSGTPRGAKCQILAFGKQITKCKPIEISRMEKYLLLANEIPATQVKAVLAPSKTETGAADLTLVSENKPVTGYFSYDNYGTRYIGPQQMTANLGFNSFITSGDSTQYTTTRVPKGGEINYNDINYSMPLDAYGTRWLVGGTRTHTHPLFVLQPAQIDGLNNNYYTTIQYPIIRKKDQSLTFRTGFNYLDSNVTTIQNLELYTDHLRSIDLGGTYNFADKWNGSNMISIDFRQGLPIWGYTADTNVQTALTSRPGGRGTYTKFAGQASRWQAIKGPISLFALASGQYAFNPLLAAEQFAFGGSQLGRGYDPAEIIADKGLAGSAELRYDLGIGRFMLQGLQFYTFYDAGVVWNYLFVGGVPVKQSATSAGAGMRFFFTKYVSGNFMWTQPLTKQVAAEELIGDGWRPRVFFSVVASWS
jgi:hemolysin activation/secretion protein